MGEVIQIRDYHLRRLTKHAADIAGELVEFAKSGGPVVEGSHPIYPNGIDDLSLSLGYAPTPYDAG